MALLTLRLALSAFVLIRAPDFCPVALFHLASIGLAILLAVGLLTPYVAIVGAIAVGTCLLVNAANLQTDSLLAIAILFAIALLGAGAFSLDALIYGRRRIILAPK